MAFGKEPQMTRYSVAGQLTVQLRGKGGTFSIDGKTNGGIRIRIEATCNNVDQF